MDESPAPVDSTPDAPGRSHGSDTSDISRSLHTSTDARHRWRMERSNWIALARQAAARALDLIAADGPRAIVGSGIPKRPPE